MCGVSLHTNKAHIVRSVLEAICYRTKDVKQILGIF
jgi:glycerol kinase